MDRVRKLMGADEIHKIGYTGKQITVAVLDTGICFHPDYADRILLFRDMVNGRKHCYDDASHGSHVTGILAGNGRISGGRYCGMAPECRLIQLKVLDQNGEGNINQILEAIDWVIDNKKRYEIRIMNISAGSTVQMKQDGTDSLVDAVERAWDEGLIVVTAAGNRGPGPMTVTAPGSSKKVITVGAADPVNCSYVYSGCGPTRECVCKPELAVPGTNIMSCSVDWKNGRYYARKSGTSMAVPVVSGAIALLLEKENNLTNTQVKMRLKESAADLGLPRSRQGWGMPDLSKLLKIQE